MGALDNKLFVKKGMYILAGVFSLLGIIFNSVAMGTNYWIVSEGSQNLTDPSVISVNYGLFNGHKSLKGKLDILPVSYSLAGICLVSCGTTNEEKQQEFDYLRFGEQPFACSPKTAIRSTSRSHLIQLANDIPVEGTSPSEPVTQNEEFMDYGLWVTTLVFLSFMLAFQIISTGLCFFNTATVPIETLIGPMGIYLSNGVVVLSGIITLSLWGDLYSSGLSSELAIQETILDKYIMSSTNLGFSYWFVLWTLILAIATMVCIRFRNSLKKISNQNDGVERSAPVGYT
ncbi:hypothetical protein DAPPUDRAFT_324573 [Daphnia pulex]|uniref:Uncharacterized protein n=1 Tax=Daphnia pulex TaxID=6669 RepID=E9H246_DAPPU|nr:hypothetical protein DAPPUDRAFT_324573 [Daphnia pulex]|eukprot:EFX74197.1 hypothetical protein DAPPUDRAFT_324573 [Daphnia pulex]